MLKQHDRMLYAELREAADLEGTKVRNRLGIFTVAGNLNAVETTIRRAEGNLGTELTYVEAPGARGEYIVREV